MILAQLGGDRDRERAAVRDAASGAATSSSGPSGRCEAARDIADAIGGEAELDRVLELIVKRGRALVDARSVVIMLRDGDELVVAASAGHAQRRSRASAADRRVDLRAGARTRSPRADHRRRHAPADRARPSSACATRTAALLVPMLHRGTRSRGARGV